MKQDRHTSGRSWIFRLLCIFILPAAIMWPVAGQEEQDADSEPADPDIILPSILLEIEDLSIETIDAILPEEEELLPPEREVPLPDEEVMEVKEPAPVTALPESGFDAVKTPSGASFAAEAILGAGYVNHILSQISFYKLGETPRYKLLFSHEMLDGFAFRDAGTGFNLREDSLEASIKGNLGKVESEVSGNFYEGEWGLQDQSEYYFSRIVRLIDGTALFSMMPSDMFRLSANIQGTYTSMSLTGAETPEFDASYPPAEVVAGGTAGGELLFDSVTFGVSAEYRYRNLLGSKDYELHRVLAKTSISIELPLSFILSGNVGYFYNTDIPWLIPFDISLSANPEQTFSFQLAGGYQVRENNLNTFWKEYPFSGFPTSLPGSDTSILPDNHGWYWNGNMT